MQIKQDCHRVVLTICFVLVLVQFGSGFSLLLEYYKKRLLEVAAEIQIMNKTFQHCSAVGCVNANISVKC